MSVGQTKHSPADVVGLRQTVELKKNEGSPSFCSYKAHLAPQKQQLLILVAREKEDGA